MRPWLALGALIVLTLAIVFVLSRGEERTPAAESSQRSSAQASAASAPVAARSADEQARPPDDVPPATKAEIAPAVEPSGQAPEPVPARERAETGAGTKTKAGKTTPTKREQKGTFRPHGP
jgi:hypothetical protein